MTKHLLAAGIILTGGIVAVAQQLPDVLPPDVPAIPAETLPQKSDKTPAAATAPAQADPKVMAALEMLHQRDATLKTFTGGFEKKDEHLRTMDVEIRTGTASYRKTPGDAGRDLTQFKAHFDKSRVEGMAGKKLNQDIMFDGRWLFIVDHDAKQFRKQEIAPPGSSFNPLKLGSALPVPIGQEPEEVVRDFVVTALEVPGRGDPKGVDAASLVHLKLVPRDAKAWDFKQLDVWVNTAKDVEMPVQVRTTSDATISTVTLKDLKINTALDEQFGSPPTPDANKGWDVTIEPYKDPRKGG